MPTRSTSIILTAGDGLTFDQGRCSFRKEFPHLYSSRGAKIGLLSLSLYNSWDNLSSSFNNLTGLSYIIDGVSYPVVYPPGSYSIDELSDYLEHTMDLAGHYLLDGTGGKVFYISWETNPVYYTATLKAIPIPSVLPADWSNPHSLPLTGDTPQIVITNPEFGRLIGFAVGTYPSAPATVETRINSSLTPEITQVSTILVLSDWVNNGRFTNYPSVIASFTPTVETGHLIHFTPQVITTYDVIPRNYTDIEIRLTDSNYRPLQIKDTSQIVITLLLEEDV